MPCLPRPFSVAFHFGASVHQTEAPSQMTRYRRRFCLDPSNLILSFNPCAMFKLSFRSSDLHMLTGLSEAVLPSSSSLDEIVISWVCLLHHRLWAHVPISMHNFDRDFSASIQPPPQSRAEGPPGPVLRRHLRSWRVRTTIRILWITVPFLSPSGRTLTPRRRQNV